MGLEAVKIVDLPKIVDARGNLSFIEEFRHIPFPIKRSYWVYDVPGGEKRDGHAFIEQVYPLNRSYYGVYVPNMIWRRLENFSTNSLALVLSSTLYDPEDYIEDYDLYLKCLEHG